MGRYEHYGSGPVVAGEERGGSLDHERQALLEVAAWSAGVESDVFGPEHEVNISATLRTLAKLTIDGARTAPRLVLLERLVRAASRRGDEFLAPDNEGLRILLNALIEEGGRRGDDVSDALETVERSLRMVNGINTVDAYSTFANQGNQVALQMQTHEVHAPACDDTGVYTSSTGITAPSVETSFYSEVPFDEFETWMDPESWPQMCPWFFTGMKLIGTKQVGANGGWRAIYDETVELIPGEEWVTRLRFEHKRRSTEHRTEYRLPLTGEVPPNAPTAPTQHLIVDHGYLSAQRSDWKYEGFVSKVTLAKTAAFADGALAKWTSIMCDTFWMDLAIAMAHTAATSTRHGPDDDIDPDDD